MIRCSNSARVAYDAEDESALEAYIICEHCGKEVGLHYQCVRVDPHRETVLVCKPCYKKIKSSK